MELIRSMEEKDIQIVKEFTDQWIGENYFSVEELFEIFQLTFHPDVKESASFLAFVDDELAGVRLTFAPGIWTKKARGISPSNWNVKTEQVAYFKSLFIAEKFQKNGLGKKLSNLSIEKIKEMKGSAIVCHSWLESPHNSSQRYLQKMGFEEIKNHEKFWYPIDYECTRCSPERCICTACEMIKYL
ncbi:GNAT family N-acetyltransferase [Bacteriovoracaceae bacterium]|nr:GNAT family N-acetyltransferase [Bacteriovoracaceae bacterium]